MGGLTLCWGEWKHCVEGVSLGYMKEGAGGFEGENRNLLKPGLIFFLLVREQFITVLG